MPKPIAICIEDLDDQYKPKYLRCVALPGRQPGLRLDEAGQVLWQSDDGVSCELWVSADDRLILYRPEDKTPVTLHRAGRSLDVPCGKPVVVIDQDQIDVGARHLRIHVHGQAPSIAAPSPLPSRPRPLGRLAQAAATAAVIGAVATAGGCTDIDVRETPPVVEIPPTVEIREDPPTVPPPPPTVEVRVAPPEVVPYELSIEEAIQGEWTAAQAYDVENERVWITGTLIIEGNSYSFTPTREITGTSVQGNLDFLFDNPTGEIEIEYESWVTPDTTFEYVDLERTFATCVFRAVSAEVERAFQIRMRDANNLHFYSLEGELDLWSVTKQIEIY